MTILATINTRSARSTFMKNKSSILKRILLCNVLLMFSCSGKTQEIDKKIIANDSDKIVTCFVYHRVGDSRYPTTNVSIKDFESHLNWLTKNNYTLLTF